MKAKEQIMQIVSKEPAMDIISGVGLSKMACVMRQES